MFTEVVFTPVEVGLQVTTKEVVPDAASVAAGKTVTVNSDALPPVKIGVPTFRIRCLPLYW